MYGFMVVVRRRAARESYDDFVQDRGRISIALAMNHRNCSARMIYSI